MSGDNKSSFYARDFKNDSTTDKEEIIAATNALSAVSTSHGGVTLLQTVLPPSQTSQENNVFIINGDTNLNPPNVLVQAPSAGKANERLAIIQNVLPNEPTCGHNANPSQTLRSTQLFTTANSSSNITGTTALKSQPAVSQVVSDSLQSSFPVLANTTQPIPASVFSYRFASPNNTQTPYYISSDIVLSGGIAQQNRRRIVHNEVEKRRKDKINRWIMQLADLIPCNGKLSKNIILEKAVHHIEGIQRLRLEASRQNQSLGEENILLKQQVKRLQRNTKIMSKLLSDNKINVSADLTANDDAVQPMDVVTAETSSLDTEKMDITSPENTEMAKQDDTSITDMDCCPTANLASRNNSSFSSHTVAAIMNSSAGNAIRAGPPVNTVAPNINVNTLNMASSMAKGGEVVATTSQISGAAKAVLPFTVVSSNSVAPPSTSRTVFSSPTSNIPSPQPTSRVQTATTSLCTQLTLPLPITCTLTPNTSGAIAGGVNVDNVSPSHFCYTTSTATGGIYDRVLTDVSSKSIAMAVATASSEKPSIGVHNILFTTGSCTSKTKVSVQSNISNITSNLSTLSKSAFNTNNTAGSSSQVKQNVTNVPVTTQPVVVNSAVSSVRQSGSHGAKTRLNQATKFPTSSTNSTSSVHHKASYVSSGCGMTTAGDLTVGGSLVTPSAVNINSVAPQIQSNSVSNTNHGYRTVGSTNKRSCHRISTTNVATVAGTVVAPTFATGVTNSAISHVGSSPASIINQRNKTVGSASIHSGHRILTANNIATVVGDVVAPIGATGSINSVIPQIGSKPASNISHGNRATGSANVNFGHKISIANNITTIGSVGIVPSVAIAATHSTAPQVGSNLATNVNHGNRIIGSAVVNSGQRTASENNGMTVGWTGVVPRVATGITNNAIPQMGSSSASNINHGNRIIGSAVVTPGQRTASVSNVNTLGAAVILPGNVNNTYLQMGQPNFVPNAIVLPTNGGNMGSSLGPKGFITGSSNPVLVTSNISNGIPLHIPQGLSNVTRTLTGTNLPQRNYSLGQSGTAPVVLTQAHVLPQRDVTSLTFSAQNLVSTTSSMNNIAPMQQGMFSVVAPIASATHSALPTAIAPPHVQIVENNPTKLVQFVTPGIGGSQMNLHGTVGVKPSNQVFIITTPATAQQTRPTSNLISATTPRTFIHNNSFQPVATSSSLTMPSSLVVAVPQIQALQGNVGTASMIQGGSQKIAQPNTIVLQQGQSLNAMPSNGSAVNSSASNMNNYVQVIPNNSSVQRISTFVPVAQTQILSHSGHPQNPISNQTISQNGFIQFSTQPSGVQNQFTLPSQQVTDTCAIIQNHPTHSMDTSVPTGGSQSLNFSAESLINSNGTTPSVSSGNVPIESFSNRHVTSTGMTSSSSDTSNSFSNFSAEALIGHHDLIDGCHSSSTNMTDNTTSNVHIYSDFSAESLIGSNDISSSLSSYAIDNLIGRNDSNTSAMQTVNPNLIHNPRRMNSSHHDQESPNVTVVDHRDNTHNNPTTLSHFKYPQNYLSGSVNPSSVHVLPGNPSTVHFSSGSHSNVQLSTVSHTNTPLGTHSGVQISAGNPSSAQLPSITLSPTSSLTQSPLKHSIDSLAQPFYHSSSSLNFGINSITETAPFHSALFSSATDFRPETVNQFSFNSARTFTSSSPASHLWAASCE